MRRVVVLTVAFAALALVGQAAAANYQVLLGEQVPCGFGAPCKGVISGIPKGTTMDRFFPKSVTINAGDAITFSSSTFHTVSYEPKSPAILFPDPAKGKYTSLNDAAGKPFWFVGMSKFIYNPLAFAPFGPKTVPGAPSSSGALSPAGPKAKPATFTYAFPKAGTYKLRCNVHPQMTASIVVKPSGAAVPKTPAQVTAQALTEVNSAWGEAKAAAAAAKPPAATVFMGVGKEATVYGYFPSTLHVKAGTTVTFVNKAPNEVHNVVFGPRKYILGLQKTTDLFPMGPKSPNQVAPFLIYGSDPKGASSYSGTSQHGNGYYSALLTADDPSIPLPRSTKVTFTTPGTYKYFCWIHGPDMGGTVVVTK